MSRRLSELFRGKVLQALRLVLRVPVRLRLPEQRTLLRGSARQRVQRVSNECGLSREPPPMRARFGGQRQVRLQRAVKPKIAFGTVVFSESYLPEVQKRRTLGSRLDLGGW